MSGKRERSVEELYRDDAARADVFAFGRKSGEDGRGFLEGAGLEALSAAVGGAIPFSSNMPAGVLPAALAEHHNGREKSGPLTLDFPGKDSGLSLIGELPLVAETPVHLLDDDTTPTEKFYIRNNGLIPDAVDDPDSWTLEIDGEVNTPLRLTLGDIKARFLAVTRRMVLECGGNGRSFYSPPAQGNPWTHGGAGCAEWTGVPLSEILRAAGIKSSAVYTAHYSPDRHVSGEAHRAALSRGVRLDKALDEHSMLVWSMNGAPLTHIHGGPVRLIYPGWTGSASQKWISRIRLRDREHDGPGMTGTHYRLPIRPIVPGDTPDLSNLRILESMPVRSIVTSPASGNRFAAGTRTLDLRGASWAGDLKVKRVDVSIDFGVSWQAAELAAPRNRYDWRRWTATVRLPSDGYFEIWSRATDSEDQAQPYIAANWNPHGYAANPIHRIAVLVG